MKVLFPVVFFCCASAALADVVFPAGETTVNDNRTYTHAANGAIVIEKDATLNISGKVEYNVSDVEMKEGCWDVPVMSMTSGSVLKVLEGGSLSITDLAGALNVNGTAESPAKIMIEGGEFKLSATRYMNISNVNKSNLLGYLTLGEHSVLEVSGNGVFELSAITGTQTPRFAALKNHGATILFKDNAQFKIGDVSGSSTLFANGYTEFSGNSVLDFSSGVNGSMGGIQIGTSASSAAMSTEVVFKDYASTRNVNPSNGSVHYGWPNAVRLANPKKGTWSTLSLQSKGTIGIGALTMVGAASVNNSWKGGSTLEITDGYVQSGGNYGLVVGHVCDGTTQFCTGIVNVAGGAYMVRAGKGGNTDEDTVFCGTLIGRGPAIAGDAVYADATLNVSGGIFTNQVAYFVVGTGRSVGRVIQTGGEIRSTPYCKRPLVVGFAGGNGLFAVSNGVTVASSDIYVGGAQLSALAKMASDNNFRTATGNDGGGMEENYELGGAVGRLVVAACDNSKECSFIAIKSQRSAGELHVGENGSGEVEVGAGGELTVNGAVFAGSGATLKCTLGEDGAGIFKVKGELKVGEGARLEVDASAYKGSRSWVKLVDAETRSGSFIVTIRNPEPTLEVVEQRLGFDDGSVWLHVRRGLCLTVK